MDFELSANQKALQDGVRKLCEGRFPMDRVRALVDDGGVDRALGASSPTQGCSRSACPSATVASAWARRSGSGVRGAGPCARARALAGTHLAAGLVDAEVVGVIERDRNAVVAHLDALDMLVAIDDAGLWAIDPPTLDAQAIADPLDPLTPVHRVDRAAARHAARGCGGGGPLATHGGGAGRGAAAGLHGGHDRPRGGLCQGAPPVRPSDRVVPGREAPAGRHARARRGGPRCGLRRRRHARRPRRSATWRAPSPPRS